jgi:tagatose-6-phosphate ketose/aldose isomerase
MEASKNVTLDEITQQPEMWLETYKVVTRERVQLDNFLKEALTLHGVEIIFTGAGSSAFIGDVLENIVQRKSNILIRSIATTDLVTDPETYFQRPTVILLISFARSGDSPESFAAIDFANRYAKKVFHLIITCNKHGRLAQLPPSPNLFVLNLPDETNDKGLAMTSSFTSMLLAGILTFNWGTEELLNFQIGLLTKYARFILDSCTSKIKEVANMKFNRAIFLGSQSMRGIATESHLKLQELTTGLVMCQHESYLGFRHGPISVVNKETLLVYLFSKNKSTLRYERDLVASLNKGMYTIGISESNNVGVKLNWNLNLDQNGKGELMEEFFPVCCVLPAQLLGYYKSLSLGLNPDDPCKDGTYSRVVQNVTIYND